MMENHQELIALGEPTLNQSSTSLGPILLRILGQFSEGFTEALEGKRNQQDGVELRELYGGARVHYVFDELFASRLAKVDAFDGLTDEDIRTSILNASGVHPPLFVPEISFYELVKMQIAKLEQPGLQCVDYIFEELQRMGYQAETKELARFPKLRDKVTEVVSHLLRKLVPQTQAMISSLIAVEMAYINTSHPDFIGGDRAAQMIGSKRRQRQQLEEEFDEKSSEENLSHQSSKQQHQQKQQEEKRRGPPSNQRANGKTPQPSNSSSMNRPPTTGGGGSGNGFFGTLLGYNNKEGERGMSPQTSNHQPPNGEIHSQNHLPQPQSGLYSENIIKLPNVPESMKASLIPTDREKTNTEVIKELIQSYFDIVRKNYMDLGLFSLINCLLKYNICVFYFDDSPKDHHALACQSNQRFSSKYTCFNTLQRRPP